MTKQDIPAVVEALKTLAAMVEQPLSERRLAAYIVALADMDAGDVLRGISGAMQTHRFATLPLPADIRQAAHGGSTDDAADLAWGEVLKAIRSVGRYGDPRRCLSDEAHAAMLATFGTWGACCDMSAEGPERQGYAKQFRGVYGAAARRTSAQQLSVAMLPDGLREQARALIGGGR